MVGSSLFRSVPESYFLSRKLLETYAAYYPRYRIRRPRITPISLL